MTIAQAALVSWAVTAMFGAFLFGTWLARGGAARAGAAELTYNRPPGYFPVPLVFVHALLALSGLVVWVAYVLIDWPVLAWVAFAVLLPVDLMGIAMFSRWVGSRRARIAARGADTDRGPAESSLPIVAVCCHGILAGATAVLVLAAAIGIGGS